MHQSIRIAATGAILATAPAAAAADDAPARHELQIIPTAATAAILPGSPGRRAVELPDLSYAFQLRHDCRAPFEPLSLSLTVLDSHRFFDPAAAGGGHSVLRSSLRLGRGQIAPVAVEGFCSVDGQSVAGAERPLTVASVLTAAASLRCASGESQEVVYTTAPLDVVLVCERPPPPDDGAAATDDDPE